MQLAQATGSLHRSACFGAKPQLSRRSRVRERYTQCEALPWHAILADIAPQVASSASQVANQASQAAPGSVDAPGWVIPVALIAVTVGGSAFAFLLKPGTDAAEKVFERDAKRLGNQAIARAQGKSLQGKASQSAKNRGQMVTKRGRK